MAKTVTKDMLIGELISMDSVIVDVLLHEGMHCVGCPSSRMESLEEACMVHGLNVDDVVDDINMVLAQNND